MKAYIFECSNATYLDCVQKSVFGSNLPWATEIKRGDNCCLYHYEVGTLFALWQAATDGGRNLVPRAWGGRFPFQVKVSLLTPEIVAIPKASASDTFLNASTGKFENVLDGDRAEEFLKLIHDHAGH
jgi:hypothetical protein